MTKLFGESANYLLFTDGANAVVIDKSTNMVEDIGSIALLSSAQAWRKEDISADKSFYDLATGALADLRVQVVVASGRMYTIPKSAQEEAKKALEWRKEHDRGGTPVGLNTARTLAEGGQIGIQKVRHIAKYFPRHEVDKKAKGYKPGEDGFPSNGRIAWALWGGDAAWRWAQAIVERENKKALRADGSTFAYDDAPDDIYYPESDYDSDVNAFSAAHELGEELGPEFIARVRLDDTGIDRLYMANEDGQVFVWDGGNWDDLGNADADISSFDRSLDDPEDDTPKHHIFLDADSALIISAHLQQSPFLPVSVYDLDPEEAELVAAASDEIDWDFIDMAMTAAGEEPLESTDGNYTPEERSKKARKQVRDKGGKFAAMGSRVIVNGDASKSGNITGINPDTQSVTVKMDDGSEVNVPAKSTEKAKNFKAQAIETPAAPGPIDVSGILGQPRAPIDRPNAKLPAGLPALTPEQLGKSLSDFPAWVKSQRDAQQAASPIGKKALTPAEQKANAEKFAKDLSKKSGVKVEAGFKDLREHPIYKNIFKKKPEYNLYYNPMISAATAPSEDKNKALTPETSDVQPMYMAIVSPDDPRAVFDLVSIVPASATSTAPMTYKRMDGKWVADPQILSDLTSATPPPVVPLHGEALSDTLAQIDKIVASAFTAAGGADRNRGNAEKLRRYWLYGKGAAKIRWNTPGDWTRCYRQLRKYMGIRAKGYCSLRHKEATGVWPGSKFNVGKKNIKASAYEEITLATEEQILNYISMKAQIADAKARVLLAAGAYEINGADPVNSAKFRIPLVIPEDIESGDGRKFRKGSIEVRELPLPLMWQIKTASGHDGSVVVGRIDHMERTENGIGNAYGVFDGGAYGQEAERMVREGFIRGVSADLDKFEASEAEAEKDSEASKKDKKIGGDKINIDHARVMAVTIVPKPAFEECRIYLDENTDAGESQEEPDMEQMPDGIYVEDMDEMEASAIVACGMVAGSIPTTPPATWFADPKLTGPTPLTVDDHGRVFGHIAAWHVNHIGMSYGTRPPRSKSKYGYFHTGVVRADDNKDYPVGQLTLAGGHASLEASAVDAARHYDDTGSAIADVTAGEDRHGIWVAGALRPSATPEQIRSLRASAPSGDWRPINGALELVAVCQVNVPGFPIARARVASGQVYALVAAGAQVLAKMKNDPIAELAQRVAALEGAKPETANAELAAMAAAAKARFNAIKSLELSIEAEIAAGTIEVPTVEVEDLRARVASAHAEAELGAISVKARKKLAAEGKALPNGSYPIRNEEDLKNAIQGYGRSKPGDRAKVRRHIMKRARALGKADIIPEEWKSASAIADDVASLKAQVASAAERLTTGESGTEQQ
jgi:hypothetical protein